MARALGLAVLGVSSWLALGALSGCNEILDIEQATLDSGGSTGSAGRAGASASDGADTPPIFHGQCEKPITPKCSGCISSACTDKQQNDCLKDKSCRVALGTYSTCLGTSCDPQAGKCLDEGLLTPTQPFGLDCVGDCGPECSGTPFLSICELYCGCMLTNCAAKVPAADASRYTALTTCINYCNALDPAIANCRWSHCERAPDEPQFRHCDHADGVGFCEATSVPTDPGDCKNKSLVGFYCKTADDCCSGKCNTATRACSPE